MKLSRRILARLSIVALIAGMLPFGASAAQLTGRTLTLSSSSTAATNATTTYTFTFTVPTTGTAIKSFQAQACTTASGTCTTPTGFANNVSTLTPPTGLGAGWTVNTATAGSLRMVSASNVTLPSGSQTVVFNNVQNPTTTPQTFYLRLTTYSDAGWLTAIDTGATAAATANQITFNGTVDETLTFCVGITVTGNCTSTTGTAVTFSPSSTFLTTSTATASSQFAAATNAGGGYIVTVNGTTLTSGARSIAAAGAQTQNGAAVISAPGSSQFGMNIPTVTNASVDSVGVAGTNFGGATNYRYFTGDTVGTTAGAPSDFNTYTANYIVNISGIQAAGVYTTTLTFICTAIF